MTECLTALTTGGRPTRARGASESVLADEFVAEAAQNAVLDMPQLPVRLQSVCAPQIEMAGHGDGL
jgi:hypothetical protein